MHYISNNIMTFVPPNEEGKLILQHALFFQKTLGMRVFVCCINEKPTLLEKLFNPQKGHDLNNLTVEKLHELSESALPADALDHIAYRVKSGKLIPLLLRQSKKGGYEFIIVDKSESETSLKPDELNKLISHSFCPIMAINKNYPLKKIKKIVIPVDVTQTTKKKLLWATYFAKKYSAKIIIISALTLNLKAKRSLGWRNAEKLRRLLSQRGVDCDLQIINAPGQEKHKVILGYIREEKPDMVIIRTHQESNRKNTQIGKFVSELIHGCKIPVFTVNSFIPAISDDFVLRL